MNNFVEVLQGPPRSLSHAATRFAGTVPEDTLPTAKRVRGAEYAPVQTPDINPGALQYSSITFFFKRIDPSGARPPSMQLLRASD